MQTNEVTIIEQSGIKKRKLASSQFNITDNETGEVLKFVDNTVEINYKSDEHFVKFYVDNLGFISNVLTEIEKKVFYGIITFMNYYNIVTLNSDMKKNIAFKQKLGKSSVYKAIDGLILKQVIVLIEDKEIMEQFGLVTNNNYLVNPNLVGKAGFKDMNKIRKTITIDYDREQKKILQRTETIETSNEFDEILKNQEKYQVIDATSTKENNDKKIENIITLEKKEQDTSKISNKELELEILRAKQALQAEENEAIKLENENLKLKMQFKKIDDEDF